jgi:hypothetical protein
MASKAAAPEPDCAAASSEIRRTRRRTVLMLGPG